MKKNEFITDFLTKYTIRQFCAEDFAFDDEIPLNHHPRRSRKKQPRKPKKFERD